LIGAWKAAAISEREHPDYRKWLRFYLDFCDKYGHAPRSGSSLSPFLAKPRLTRARPWFGHLQISEPRAVILAIIATAIVQATKHHSASWQLVFTRSRRIFFSRARRLFLSLFLHRKSSLTNVPATDHVNRPVGPAVFASFAGTDGFLLHVCRNLTRPDFDPTSRGTGETAKSTEIGIGTTKTLRQDRASDVFPRRPVS
jgi:hypothetical protein